MLLTLSQAKRVCALAREAGFDLAGVAAVPDPEEIGEKAKTAQFAQWIADGRAGEMAYLKRADDSGAPVRGALRRAVPWARSVLVCAVNYNSGAAHSSDPAPQGSGWLARYAISGNADGKATDYHDALLTRLRQLEQRMHEELGAFRSRCYVDTGPIVEREYARRAGVGWVGKNTCLIDQQQGSWLYLGVVVMAVELSGEELQPMAEDRCGTCTRCLDACPTHALDKPYEMDASLCISYLTIEKRGIIPDELKQGIGRQVFGCDICQEVCPWNRKAPATVWPELQSRPELVNPALEWLASLDVPAYKRLFRGSPVERTKLRGLRRNVAVAMGNHGSREHEETLTAWLADEDDGIRDAARWALGRIRNRDGDK